MDLQKRVKEILDGRIKLGAGAPKKSKAKSKPRRRQPVLREVPPMYEVPHTDTDNRRYTRLADQYIGQNPKITDEMLMHHYPVSAEVMGTDPHDPDMMAALQDIVSSKDPVAKKAGGYMAERLGMPLVGYGMYAQNVKAGRQVSKNKGGKVVTKPNKCRKGCKHMRCAMAKAKKGGITQRAGVQIAGMLERGAVCGGETMVDKAKAMHIGRVKMGAAKKCPKGCHCTHCKSAKKAKKSKPKKKKAPSEWIQYVKEFAKLNNISYKDALKEAGPSYHAQA